MSNPEKRKWAARKSSSGNVLGQATKTVGVSHINGPPPLTAAQKTAAFIGSKQRTGGQIQADRLSRRAAASTMKAQRSGLKADHDIAHMNHLKAAQAHTGLGRGAEEMGRNNALANTHRMQAGLHLGVSRDLSARPIGTVIVPAKATPSRYSKVTGKELKEPVATYNKRLATDASKHANNSSLLANRNGSAQAHVEAAKQHGLAAEAHSKAAVAPMHGGTPKEYLGHIDKMNKHIQTGAQHKIAAIKAGANPESVGLNKAAGRVGEPHNSPVSAAEARSQEARMASARAYNSGTSGTERAKLYNHAAVLHTDAAHAHRREGNVTEAAKHDKIAGQMRESSVRHSKPRPGVPGPNTLRTDPKSGLKSPDPRKDPRRVAIGLSKAADNASRKAYSSYNPDDHNVAARAHEKAYVAHRDIGQTFRAQKHQAEFNKHIQEANDIRAHEKSTGKSLTAGVHRGTTTGGPLTHDQRQQMPGMAKATRSEGGLNHSQRMAGLTKAQVRKPAGFYKSDTPGRTKAPSMYNAAQDAKARVNPTHDKNGARLMRQSPESVQHHALTQATEHHDHAVRKTAMANAKPSLASHSSASKAHALAAQHAISPDLKAHHEEQARFHKLQASIHGARIFKQRKPGPGQHHGKGGRFVGPGQV